MENKILIAVSVIGSLVAIFTPMPEHKYQIKKKDPVSIEAEKYLHELEKENQHKINDLTHDVDSLMTVKRKIKYIYIKRDSL